MTDFLGDLFLFWLYAAGIFALIAFIAWLLIYAVGYASYWLGRDDEDDHRD